MKRLYIKLGDERQCHITKQLVHSFFGNIRISQPSKVMFASASPVLVLTNPDVNLKIMHQMYIVRYSPVILITLQISGMAP